MVKVSLHDHSIVVLVTVLILVSIAVFLAVGTPKISRATKTGGSTTLSDLMNDPTYQLACQLYEKDLFVRKLNEKPSFTCFMECPNIETLGYCPEEMYIQAVINEQAKKLLGVTELERDIERELYMIGSSVRTLYRYMRAGDERAELMKDGKITTMHFTFSYADAYNVLEEFIERKEVSVLKGLANALSSR